MNSEIVAIILGVVIVVIGLPFIVSVAMFFGSCITDVILAVVKDYASMWKKMLDIIFNRGE